MLERIIRQCKFNNCSPIEIFCDQKFNEQYFVRGQIIEFSDDIHSPQKEDVVSYAKYNYAIIVLVNDAYQQQIKESNCDECRFIFEGNTEEDYLKLRKEFYRKNPKIREEIMRYAKALGGIDKYENKNILISLDEIKPLTRKYREYLGKSMKLKKNSIVLEMEIYFKSLGQDTEFFPDSKFLIPILHFSKNNIEVQDFDMLEPEDFEFDTFLNSLVELLHNDLQYDDQKYLDQETYQKIMQDIGDIGYQLIKMSRISKKFLGILERFKHSIGDRANPLTDFCYSFYDDLEDYLRSKKCIKYCPICNSYYHGTKESVYCKKCKSNQKSRETVAYDEIQRILKECGISQDMPLEDIYRLFANLSEKKDLIITLLCDRLVRENPGKNKSDIYKELADKLHISESTVTHAKYKSKF